jgi:uncharacterized coiled-coil protein SlyX
LNKSQLAKRFDLDRATVTKRLDANAVEPVESKSNEALYELTPRVAGILAKVDSAFDEAKLRKETAEAELREAKVAVIRGDLVEAAKVMDRVQTIMTALYKEFAQQQPKRLAARLAKVKTAAEVTKLIKADTDKVFSRLRENDEEMIPDRK